MPLPEQSSWALSRQLLAGEPTPSQQMSQQELVNRLSQAVNQLSVADRDVVMMRQYERLSNREVACLLGIDPATASKRLGRAMLRLHQILFEDGLTESQL